MKIIKNIVCYIFFTIIGITSVQAKNNVDGVRIWAAPDSTRVVFDLKDVPVYSSQYKEKPYQLIIDIKNTSSKVDLSKLANNSKIVTKVKIDTLKAKGIRATIDLAMPVKTHIFSLPPTAPYGNRLVIDVTPVQQDSSKKDIIKPNQSTNIPEMLKRHTKRDIIIALDPGHGGDDPGSIGKHGLYEKVVVLQIASKLATYLNKEPGFKAIMLRKSDYFINLNQRSELARKNKADLLISIHADSFTSSEPRGASVWVLSMRRANTEIGRWLEKDQKRSDLLGGAGEIMRHSKNEQYLAMTLLDMSMDRSMAVSYDIAKDVLSTLGKVTRLHKVHPEKASFAVLKSPDIPSLLIETGFMSNLAEEKMLKDSKHQNIIAKAISRGVVSYFKKNPIQDSIFDRSVNTANAKAAIKNNPNVKSKVKGKELKKELKPLIHIVAKGQSLSFVANKYKVSIGVIKEFNNLKTDAIKIGQKLKIPVR